MNCAKAFLMTVEEFGICGTNPSAIQDMVWLDDSPICGVMTLIGGSGSYSATGDFAGCPFGIASASGVICNPGAPYTATFMFTYTLSGNHIVIGTDQLLYELFVDANPVGAFATVLGPANGSSGSASFNYLVPTGTMTFQVRASNQLFPNPSSTFAGTVTITPATPP